MKLQILSAAMLLGSSIHAQVVCDVSSEALKGTYTGDCKNGKANGTGKATGKDSYEGTFKNGLPDGEGVYRYANGDYYSGEFSKGLMNGKGEFHPGGSADSVQRGEWVNGQYKSYDKPYGIISKSVEISKLTIREVKQGIEGVVQIDSKYIIPAPDRASLTGGAANSPQRTDKDLPADVFLAGSKPEKSDSKFNINQDKNLTKLLAVTEISVSEGSYTNLLRRSTDKISTAELQSVKFPFKAIIYFGPGYMAEIQINKPGNWRIEAVASQNE